MSVHLPRLIQSGMVLQRDTEARLFGTADEPVTVTFLGKEYHAQPDARGHWSVFLRGLPPGGPHTLHINEITLRDVYVGDVWLCSGQSNMQLPMRRVRHRYPEELLRPCPAIRQFAVPQRVSFHAPQEDLDGGEWMATSTQTIEDFSAVGYFFAKRLYARYGVPIGLLLSAIGGTPIHAWMNRDALRGFPDLLREADRCADDEYVARTQAEDACRAVEAMRRTDDADPGLAERWYLPDWDDSAWPERPLLAPWAEAGSVWLRKTLTIPPALAGKPATLFLGTVVDWDTVYVNGVTVGNTTYRYPPREYSVPALPEGHCVLAIRAISHSGGGFTPGKPHWLTTDAGSIPLDGPWRFHPGAPGGPPSPAPTNFHYMPTSLYNGMLAPLQRLAIKGAIWYQGESDAAVPGRYAEKFARMADAWRAEWGISFPILFVELAHWGEGPHWDALRAQQHACLSIPGTAMAAAYDLGEHNDLHPQGKRAVGDRLARCAMRVAYGETLPHSPFEVVGTRA